MIGSGGERPGWPVGGPAGRLLLAALTWQTPVDSGLASAASALAAWWPRRAGGAVQPA